MRHRVYLGLLILLAGCSQSQPAIQPSPNVEATVSVRVAATVAAQPKPAASVAPARPPGAPRVPVTVEGALDSQTPPFQLDGGSYAVAWSVTPRPDGGCVGGLTLRSPGQTTFQQSIVSGIDAKSNPSGTTQAYGVTAGSYYVSSGSNCPGWSITFTPT